MKLEINVTILDTNNTVMARQLEQALLRRLAGHGLSAVRSGSPVLCDIPAELQQEVDRLLRQESPKPTVEPEPGRGEYAQSLTELSALLAQILNTPSEKKLREMRDLVDRALHGLVVKAGRSKKLRMGWYENCLFYHDDRVAASCFRLSHGEWTGFFLGPNDLVPTPLLSTYRGDDLARDELMVQLQRLGADFAPSRTYPEKS